MADDDDPGSSPASVTAVELSSVASVPIQTRWSGCDAFATMAAGVRGLPAGAHRGSGGCPTARRRPSGRRPSPARRQRAEHRARTPSGAWPLTTTNPDARPRCVTGIPASAGAAIADVTPGTTSNGTPASSQRRRFFAASAEHERIAGLEPHDALAAPRGGHHALGDVRLRQRLRDRRASRPTRASRPPRASRVASAPARRTARGRRRAGAESRARSEAPDRPDRRRRATRTRRASDALVARVDVSRDSSPLATGSVRRSSRISASSNCGRRASIGTPVDRHSRLSSSARANHSSRSCGSIASSPSRSRPASAGARPLVEIAIVDAVAPEHTAEVRGGVRGIVDGVHEEAAGARLPAATARFTSGVAAATTSHCPSRSAALERRARRSGLPSPNRLAHVGRHDGDVGAGGTKRVDLAGGDDTTADDEHRAPGELQKDGKQLGRQPTQQESPENTNAREPSPVPRAEVFIEVDLYQVTRDAPHRTGVPVLAGTGATVTRVSSAEHGRGHGSTRVRGMRSRTSRCPDACESSAV